MKANPIVLRILVAALVATSIASLAWVYLTSRAQMEAFRALLFAHSQLVGAVEDQENDTEDQDFVHPSLRKMSDYHWRIPNSKAGSSTWKAMQTPIDFPFATPTPLSDALEYVRNDIENKNPEKLPINISIDQSGFPRGKSLKSKVVLDFRGVAANEGLALLLAQLELVHYVDDAGVVFVKSLYSDGLPPDAFARTGTAEAPQRSEGSEKHHQGSRRRRGDKRERGSEKGVRSRLDFHKLDANTTSFDWRRCSLTTMPLITSTRGSPF